MADRLLLALEGSTRRCSAALLHRRAGAIPGRDPWVVVARRVEPDGQGHARALLSFVDEMLEEACLLPRDLAAVVGGTGPGTFTGVRIAVATARALGLALSVPVLGVSSLGALAARAAATALGGRMRLDMLVPVVDARRGQVFYALYRRGGLGEARDAERWIRTADFGVCDRNALGAVIEALRDDRLTAEGCNGQGARAETALLVGESGWVTGELPAGVVFGSIDLEAEWLIRGQDLLEEPGRLPKGTRLSPWLEQVFTEGRAADFSQGLVGGPGAPESVTPEYVRCPDADVQITKMKDPWANAAPRTVGSP